MSFIIALLDLPGDLQDLGVRGFSLSRVVAIGRRRLGYDCLIRGFQILWPALLHVTIQLIESSVGFIRGFPHCLFLAEPLYD